ncbi:oligosaccharide flippase family protein [Jiulongibacter sp. NS-SX5]|uniref:oligosaccharide flippase family protein n=1 Tax=Jiulongibacter sp. NS-SX5 TaxID=3463854 RepID=UPI004057FAA4
MKVKAALMSEKLKQTIRYLSSSFVIQILNLSFSFFLIRKLSLENVGRFNLAKTLAGFFQYSSFGLRYAMDRRLPNGSRTTNWHLLLICIQFSNFFNIPLLLIFFINYEYNYQYLIYCFGGILFSNFTILKVYYRGIGKVSKFIWLSTIGGIVTVVFPFIGLALFGLDGAIIGYTISTVLLFLYYFRSLGSIFTRISFKVFKGIYFKKLFFLGMPLFVTNVLVFLGDNLDKILIEKELGLENLGIFSIVILVYSVSAILPSILVEMYFPDYIKLKKDREINNLFLRHVLVSAVFIVTLILATYALLPVIINYFFLDYVHILPLMNIILLSVFPFIIISPIYCYLFAFDRNNLISLAKVASIFFYFSVLVYILKNSQSLEYIVINKVVSVYVYMLLLILFFLRTRLNVSYSK